jgi:hypothetical protein
MTGSSPVKTYQIAIPNFVTPGLDPGVYVYLTHSKVMDAMGQR